MKAFLVCLALLALSGCNLVRVLDYNARAGVKPVIVRADNGGFWVGRRVEVVSSSATTKAAISKAVADMDAINVTFGPVK